MPGPESPPCHARDSRAAAGAGAQPAMGGQSWVTGHRKPLNGAPPCLSPDRDPRPPHPDLAYSTRRVYRPLHLPRTRWGRPCRSWGPRGRDPIPRFPTFRTRSARLCQVAPDSSVRLPRGAIPVSLGGPAPQWQVDYGAEAPQVPAFKGFHSAGGRETRAPRHP
ncbi:unnamed protein product [Rangifer tarandus platyrhynchus]|uniref:Uncharacterized protein n=1 Tax=Rangifer tarandus platyrhynchus TaxID=3082113 RepID=A0AC59ZVK5_RANTA